MHQQAMPNQNVRCTLNCGCATYIPDSEDNRACANCSHSWVAHALDRLRVTDLCLLGNPGPVDQQSIFDIASLVLLYSRAIPVRVKILLDRLFARVPDDMLLKVLSSVGWNYEDYARGYVYRSQGSSQITSPGGNSSSSNSTTSNGQQQPVRLDFHPCLSRTEEANVVPLFLRWAETSSVANKMMAQEAHDRDVNAANSAASSNNGLMRSQTRVSNNNSPFPNRSGIGQQQPQQVPTPPNNPPINQNNNISRDILNNLSLLASGTPNKALLTQMLAAQLGIQQHQQALNNATLPPPQANDVRMATPPSSHKTGRNSINNGGQQQQRSGGGGGSGSGPRGNVPLNQLKMQHELTFDGGVLNLTTKKTHHHHKVPGPKPKQQPYNPQQQFSNTTTASPPSPLALALDNSSNNGAALNNSVNGYPADLSIKPGSKRKSYSSVINNVAFPKQQAVSPPPVSHSGTEEEASGALMMNTSGDGGDGDDSSLRMSPDTYGFGGYVMGDNGKKRVVCSKCTKSFCDKGALKIHNSAVHKREMHRCTVEGCSMHFSSRRSRNRHSANPNPKLHTPFRTRLHFDVDDPNKPSSFVGELLPARNRPDHEFGEELATLPEDLTMTAPNSHTGNVEKPPGSCTSDDDEETAQQTQGGSTPIDFSNQEVAANLAPNDFSTPIAAKRSRKSAKPTRISNIAPPTSSEVVANDNDEVAEQQRHDVDAMTGQDNVEKDEEENLSPIDFAAVKADEQPLTLLTTSL